MAIYWVVWTGTSFIIAWQIHTSYGSNLLHKFYDKSHKFVLQTSTILQSTFSTLTNNTNYEHKIHKHSFLYIRISTLKLSKKVKAPGTAVRMDKPHYHKIDKIGFRA